MIYDIEGQGISEGLLKEGILTLDFNRAFQLVSMFITKRNVKQLHENIMTHQSTYKKTLDLAPRGFGKSTVGDVDYCITKILREPNIRIMIGSKTQGQAEAFLKEIRTHFEMNEDLLTVFGDLKGDKWTDKEFTVNTRKQIKKEATVTALGASGAVVSKHFDIIIADDLVGFENARTETQRTKLKDWFYSALYPTLEPHGEIHVLGTRYHPLDLYNDLALSGNYDVLTQQAIIKMSHERFKEKNKGELSDELIAEYLKNIKDGQEFSLWEDKFTLEILSNIRKESGSIAFSMQYQNDTELAKGTIFKAQYFRHFEEYRIDEKTKTVMVKFTDKYGVTEWRNVKVFMGVDLAISQKASADYFVITVIGIDKDNNIFVLDYVKERLSFDKQFNMIVKYGTDKFPMAERIGVEAVAYQQAMCQELRRSSMLPIIDLHTGTDKVSRANRRSALFENGKVYFRDNMQDLEECLLLFPEVEHDDLFDSLDFAITVSEKMNNVRVLDRKNFRL